MTLREREIVHEAGDYWVLDAGDSYAVMRIGVTHSVSESAYSHDLDGLSIAVARCNYLASR